MGRFQHNNMVIIIASRLYYTTHLQMPVTRPLGWILLHLSWKRKSYCSSKICGTLYVVIFLFIYLFCSAEHRLIGILFYNGVMSCWLCAQCMWRWQMLPWRKNDICPVGNPGLSGFTISQIRTGRMWLIRIKLSFKLQSEEKRQHSCIYHWLYIVGHLVREFSRNCHLKIIWFLVNVFIQYLVTCIWHYPMVFNDLHKEMPHYLHRNNLLFNPGKKRRKHMLVKS